MFLRTDFKLCVLWMLLFIQVLLVMCYLLLSPVSMDSTSMPHHDKYSGNSYPVQFVSPNTKTVVALPQTPEFLTVGSKINLNEDVMDSYYLVVSNATCFIQGTDIDYMKRFANRNNVSIKCECRQGWHGRDCGQPEVIWRAFIASRQKILPKRRTKPRRIIHGFPIVGQERTLAEIKVNELANTVDLFVICESNFTETGDTKPFYFQDRLLKKYLKTVQHQILYLPFTSYKGAYNSNDYSHIEAMRKYLWQHGRTVISNLRPDDLFVLMDASEIPNKKALMFLKLYDGWPQPIGFRLRWSVYGFFWQHPKMTIIAPGASTVQLIEDTFHNDASKIQTQLVTKQDQVNSASPFGLVVGDLNHYGGWYCDWCFDPKDIVTALQQTPRAVSPVDWDKVDRKKIDTAFIEDLVGTGLWLDNKTPLTRKSQYQDPYFAPDYVLNNTWKYDSLFTNFYAKLDYY